MIKTITLKFGAGLGSPPLKLQPGAVTVFVGPNNSGKSRVLTEISEFCDDNAQSERVIIDSIELEPLSEGEAEKAVDRITLKPVPGTALQEGIIEVGNPRFRHKIPRPELIRALQMPSDRRFLHEVRAWYLKHRKLMLGGKDRITLTNEQPGGDFDTPPQTTFQVLFKDDERREALRRVVYDALGMYLVIDPTHSGKLRLRLSRRAPIDNTEEQGLYAKAREFHAAAMPISRTSDGVKAFVGIMSEIVAGDPDILMIDEPEAFLHPSLASILGREVALAGAGENKAIFVSTHSPMFLMGCIQSGAPVNIVRLTYRNDVATARILQNEDLLRLMRNPLLRSAGVIGGLFYEFVVVTESDADRAFYQEVNDRMLRFGSGGIPNCLFLHAQNKQTVRTIIQPLRELGIPTAGIVDIDVIKDGGKNWTDLLSSAFVPAIEHTYLGQARAAIHGQMLASGKDMKREGGVGILSGPDREAASNLFDKLDQYGVFTVRRGELEKWLPELGVGGHGPTWLIPMFEQMGEDPESPTYVKPSCGDVWEFIQSVGAWLTNPVRRGIPT